MNSTAADATSSGRSSEIARLAGRAIPSSYGSAITAYVQPAARGPLERRTRRLPPALIPGLRRGHGVLPGQRGFPRSRAVTVFLYRHKHRLLDAPVLALGDLLELVLDFGWQTKSHSHTVMVSERCALLRPRVALRLAVPCARRRQLREAYGLRPIAAKAPTSEAGRTWLWLILGPPFRHGLKARRDEFEAIEEPEELVLGPVLERDPGAAVAPVSALRLGVEVLGGVLDGQVTAGRQGRHEPGHDVPGVIVVRDEVQDPEDRQRDRLRQIEGLPQPRVTKNLVRVAQVGVDVGGGALGVLVSRARAWVSTIGSLST